MFLSTTEMNFFSQNGKVETGPSCVKSIHVNIWFQWNHASRNQTAPEFHFDSIQGLFTHISVMTPSEPSQWSEIRRKSVQTQT